MNEIKAWFNSLQSRERNLIISAGVILGIIMLYSLMWSPFVQSLQQLRMGVETAEDNLVWMKQAEQEVRQSKIGRGTRKPQSLQGRSLLGVVDQTRAKSQIPDAKRIEEEGKNGVRVTIENVPFDKLILWFGILQRQYGIEVADLIVDKQENEGLVNVRLILQGPGS